MNAYRPLPKNTLWELTDASDIDAVCVESTPVYIKKAQLPAEEYERILAEASQYAIHSEETLERSQGEEKYTGKPIEIRADHIVVNDGRFAGVLLLCTDSEESYLHSCTPKYHMGIAFTDGSSVGITQDTQDRSPGIWHLTKRYFLKNKI
jgi:hypothetical protein